MWQEGVLWREPHWVLRLEGIYLESQEEYPERIVIRCVQVCPFRVVVSTHWLVLGKGYLVNAAGPNVRRGFALSGFAALLGLELKHSRGLDESDAGQNLIVPGA